MSGRRCISLSGASILKQRIQGLWGPYFWAIVLVGVLGGGEVTAANLPEVDWRHATEADLIRFLWAKYPKGDFVYIDDMVFEKDEVLSKGGFTGDLWTDGIIPVRFMSGFDENMQDVFWQACAEWENAAPIDFQGWTGQDQYIKVYYHDELNNSMVGMQPEPQDMNIHDWNDIWLVAHELGHALGMRHEHQRCDRGRFVEILWDNIEEGEEHNFVRMCEIQEYTDYDFDSIMHYRFNTFGDPAGSRTIQPKEGFEDFSESMGDYCYDNNALPPLDDQSMFQRYSTEEYLRWTLYGGTTEIDGRHDHTDTIEMVSPTYLSNEVGGTREISDSFYLGFNEYATVYEATWVASGEEFESPSTSNGVRFILDGGGYKQFNSTFTDEDFSALRWIHTGTNDLEYRLYGTYVIGAGDFRWNVDESILTLKKCKLAWMVTQEFDDNDLDDWEYAWVHGRVYFDLETEENRGDLQLFINGRSCDQVDCRQGYFEFEHGDLDEGSNLIVIRGDADDETEVTIGNIRLEIKLYQGEPLLECHKEFSPDEPLVGEVIVVRNYFSNVGSNGAQEVEFDDRPLPSGVTLIGGDVYGEISGIGPGQTAIQEYTVSIASAGSYVFSSSVVAYEDPEGYNFSATMGQETLTVLSPVPEAPAGVSLSNYTALAGSDVFLSWDPVDQADEYRVFHDGDLVGTVEVSQYQLSNLALDDSGAYAVQACNPNGCSESSPAVSLIVECPEPPADLVEFTGQSRNISVYCDASNMEGSYSDSDYAAGQCFADFDGSLSVAMSPPDGCESFASASQISTFGTNQITAEGYLQVWADCWVGMYDVGAEAHFSFWASFDLVTAAQYDLSVRLLANASYGRDGYFVFQNAVGDTIDSFAISSDGIPPQLSSGLLEAGAYLVSMTMNTEVSGGPPPADALGQFSLSFSPVDSSRTSFWASPTGDDLGSGTEADPFATIARALSFSTPGDTIFLNPGTYSGAGNQNIDLPHNLVISGVDSPNIPEILVDVDSVGFILPDVTEGSGTRFENLILSGGGVLIDNSGLEFPTGLFSVANVTFNVVGVGLDGGPCQFGADIGDCEFFGVDGNGVTAIQHYNGGMNVIRTSFVGLSQGYQMQDSDYYTHTSIDSCYFSRVDQALVNPAIADNLTVNHTTFHDVDGVLIGSGRLQNCTVDGSVNPFRGGGMAVDLSLENSLVKNVTGELLHLNGEDPGLEIRDSLFDEIHSLGAVEGVSVGWAHHALVDIENSVFAGFDIGLEVARPNFSCVIANCLFSGGEPLTVGYSISQGDITLSNNTFGVLSGNGLVLSGDISANIENNVIVGATGSGIVLSEYYIGTPTITCNNLYNNAGGNYVGIADQAGLNGNISADPLFCDFAGGNYGLDAASPCAPANSPCGELIGSQEVACGINPGSFADIGGVAALTGTPNTTGVAWADADGDGDLDAYVLVRLEPNVLLVNDGLGGFSVATGGAHSDPGPGKCASWGDYDNDGLPDLYVVNSGTPNLLLHNDGGLSFSDVTSGQLGRDSSDEECAWVNFDRDGFLDLYVTDANGPNLLLQGGPGGSFTSLTPPFEFSGNSHGHAWGDYDNDGYQDLYLCTGDDINQLFHNDGNGQFTDTENDTLAVGGTSEGAAWGDYDNDGFLDLYVSQWGTGSRLFHNNGDGSFSDATTGPLDLLANTQTAAWGDYDNDGDLDLFLSHFSNPNQLLRNDGAAGFTDVTTTYPELADEGASTSVTWVDYDSDGRLDLYTSLRGQDNHMYRNEVSNGNHWLQIDLVPEYGLRSYHGARVEVTAGGQTQIREVSGRTGYMSQGPSRLCFGLGSATVIDEIKVTWPRTLNPGSILHQSSLLGVTDIDQLLSISEPVVSGVEEEAEGAAVPAAYALHGAYPNPFNPLTTLSYDLPRTSRVNLVIYDVSGRRVRTLRQGEEQVAGHYEVIWQGRDDRGRGVSTGVYFYQLEADGFRDTRRMTLIK